MANPNLYLDIQTAIQALWTAGWTVDATEVPVYWKTNNLPILPDPSVIRHFLLLEVSFTQERGVAFGGGRGQNERLQFGSVIIRVFTARRVTNNTRQLVLLGTAMDIYRTVKTGALSFIGEGSGFDEDAIPDGNWNIHGAQMVWEYRFRG